MATRDSESASGGDQHHYALLPRTPWAGPSAVCINAPHLDLHRGELLEPPSEVLRYELRVEPDADNPLKFPPLDLHDAGKGHLLMSERMVRCLEDVGIVNIQYFRGEAIYLPTKVVIPYQVGNIVGLVRALDLNAAECDVDEDGLVETFYTLRLDKNRISGLDIFRMHESFHTIIISNRVRRSLESQKVTGVSFMGEADWEPGTI